MYFLYVTVTAHERGVQPTTIICIIIDQVIIHFIYYEQRLGQQSQHYHAIKNKYIPHCIEIKLAHSFLW